ncbi:MAG: MscL family protein, partial [Sweet potato little leaf phytoplasma]|nr:MscL family protein [Sweet potato little leaf phytoplasma]
MDFKIEKLCEKTWKKLYVGISLHTTIKTLTTKRENKKISFSPFLFQKGFQDFINKGNIIQLAVAFILGQLFTKVV